MKNINECLLKTKHKSTDCLYWYLLVLIPVIIAVSSILKSSIELLLIYLLVFILSQAVIFRFLCTHCPHYCNGSKRLKCMFLWNFPKLFKPRPGPWKLVDKIMILLATVLVCTFPIYWIWPDKLLFSLYIISGIIFIATLKKFECSRCIYFHCPNNNVSKEIRDEFNFN